MEFLLDEDTERELAEKLRHASHDVERVVESPRLGPGATDAEVREFARRSGRLLITYDDDHVSVSPDGHAGVFYCPDQRLSSFTVFRIVQQVAKHYPNQAELPPVVYLTKRWIQ